VIRRRPGHRGAWAALAAGTVALAAAVVTLASPPDPAPMGAPAPSTIGSAPPARSVEQARSIADGPPHRLVIPDQSVRAEIDPAGVDRDGALLVPADPARVGWWIGGATPGAQRGTMLIAGHVDTAKDGPGALYHLRRLRVGALVEVDGATGRHRYRVTGRRSYGKAHLPPALFSRDTPHVLALVTCGGTFANGEYSRNVVVYASPAG
jgi:Sortase domain